jgi:urocanate hydratase
MDPSPGNRQFEMLRLYGELISERENWGGALVLAFGADAYLAPVPVSIAGGATLLIDDDAAAIKASMRRGELDFVVNTLDEALRALKNQIRQKRPLGVGLVASLPAALEEIVDRGILPDLTLQAPLTSATSIAIEKTLDSLRSAGMPFRLLAGKDDERGTPSWIALRGKRYYAWHVQAQSSEDLRAADALLLSVIPEDDFARRRWVQLAPRYLRNSAQSGRWVWLSKKESDALLDLLPITPESRP